MIDMMAEAKQGIRIQCIFCGGSSQLAESGGDIISKDGISAHQYCLYFSSGLAQRGDEERGEGLYGFLAQDIRAEVRRSLPFKCTVCGGKGASIGCAVKRCRCIGHYSCLQSKDYLFQHFENFETFCPKHSPRQQAVYVRQSECPICLLSINAEPGFAQIYCPSCKTYFHRDCVQRQGLSAGRYYMRCPVCNDKDCYMQEMLTMGIAVPEKDAEWELSGQFVEDGESSKYCRAESCLCTLGRSHHSGIGKYKMRKCVSCGQWMGHVLCLKGQSEQCADCVVIPLQRPKPPHPTTTQNRSSAQCTCAVCVAKYSLNVGGEHTSRATKPNKHLTVSIPRRLVKLSHKSLTVSVPLKRFQYKQRKGLKVAISRAPLHSSLEREVKGQASVHPVIKALSRQYPQVKVLSFIPLPLYTPYQLLHLYKPRGLPSEKQVESRQVDYSEMGKQSTVVELRQPLQSEMDNKVELIQSEKQQPDEELEPREVYADSPLLQILYDYSIGDKSKS